MNANGCRVFDVGAGAGGPLLTEITPFPWHPTIPHHFYEIGNVGTLDETLAIGTPVLLGIAFAGGGSYWVPTSRNPPSALVWPNGYTSIELCTNNRQLNGKNTGTMKRSTSGQRVYRATDLLIWVPSAALVAGAGTLGVPTPTIWDIDF